MATDFMTSGWREPRRIAIAGAASVAAILLAQVSWMRPVEATLPPKTSARVVLPVTAVHAPEIYAPRAESLETPLSALKAGIRWSAMDRSVASPAGEPSNRIAEAKPAARPKFASAATPLPPRRPAERTVRSQIAPEGPPVVAEVIESRTKIGNVELPRFVSSSVSLMRKLGDLKSPFETVGSSIGRLLRISAL